MMPRTHKVRLDSRPLTEEWVYAVLDRTKPNWRKEMDPNKYKTFEAYEKDFFSAVLEGCVKLGIEVQFQQ